LDAANDTAQGLREYGYQQYRGDQVPGDEWNKTEGKDCPKPLGDWENQLAYENRNWQTKFDPDKNACVISAQSKLTQTQPENPLLYKHQNRKFDQITYKPDHPSSHIQVNDDGKLQAIARPGVTSGWSLNPWAGCPNQDYWKTHAPTDWETTKGWKNFGSCF